MFSLALGFGGTIYLAKGNKTKHNCMWDSFVIGIINSLSSILAACTVFSMLGVLAKKSGQNIEDVSSGN